MSSSKFKNYLHSNSSFFIFLGSAFVLFAILAYTMPELQAPKYREAINNTLAPMWLSGAVSGYLVAGVVGYISTGEESGYVVSGLLAWLLLTGICFYAFILITGGTGQTVSIERLIERANDTTKSGESLVEPKIDLDELTR